MAPASAPVILIVEDNATTRKLVRVTLRQHGYAVLEAPDGATALSVLSGGAAPGLILQDLVLPDMTGFDLVRRIRGLPHTAETPILAFTGFLTRVDEAHMAASGFNGVLIKPVEPSRLVREIEPYFSPEVEAVVQGGPRVLVVDDDPIQLKLTRVTLGGYGFDVTVAGSGAEALKRVRRERPAVVLSDVLMPEMDGFELAARIRTDPATRTLPVLLITNHYVDDEDRRLARQMGAQDLVLRAPDLAEAVDRLRGLIGTEPSEVPQLGSFSDVQRVYLKRLTTQLTRQVETNVGLAQRVSLLATSMSVLGTVARMLGSTDAKLAVNEVLAQCVDAAGLSRGALFMHGAGEDGWRCAAQVGFGTVAQVQLNSLFGYTSVLDAVLQEGGARALTSDDPDPAVQTLLARCGASSAILAEVDTGTGEAGVLMLIASKVDVGGVEWLGFAQAIAGQLGQALALGEAFRTLAESEAQNRMLVESAVEYSLVLLDVDGRIRTWNAGAQRLHGYDARDIIGRSFAVFHTPEDVAAGLPDALLRRTLEEGKGRAEGWRIRADGSRFWAETLLTVVRGPDGGITGIARITHDFTERRRAEARFRHAVDAAPNGMVMVDEAGEIVLVNKQLTRMFGYEADELIGRPVEALLPERLREGHLRFRRDYTAHSSERPMGAGRDLYGMRSDGTEFPVEIGLNPVDDEGAFFVIASIIDITERKAAEQKLASREARVRTLMDRANDGISVLSTEGVVLETNQRWSEILGVPMDEIVGKRLGAFVAGPEELERFRDALRTGAATIRGVRVRRTDGTVRVLDISQSTVSLGDQKVLLTISRDVTNEEMLERQLRQAQKMEAIGRLAGGIAHDFNNLLTAIQGNAQFVLEMLPHGSGMRADVEEIMRAGERAAALTGQLLAFSRKQVLSPRVLDLAELVRGTEKMLTRVIGEDIHLMTALDPRTGNVRADPGQIEQVILNLAVNARDAMPSGGRITIETRAVELDESYEAGHTRVVPGPYVLLAVTDTGIGMSEEVQARIFEPFFTTKDSGKGTGLGLSTVYGIVEQSGGFIWVYSEVGVGTTFKVYLPRFVGEEESRRPTRGDEPPRGDEMVLVAEDDPLVRRLLVRSLERFGYTVHAAADPEEALRIASGLSAPADLLITDVVMPGTSGRVLAERLSERWPGLRVLYTSGYTDDAIVHHGVLEAGVAFLQKPYTPAAVAEKVREVLDR